MQSHLKRQNLKLFCRIVVELTGEIRAEDILRDITDNTWRGNLFEVKNEEQDTSKEVCSKPDLDSVIEEVHLDEGIRKQLLHRYKQEEEKELQEEQRKQEERRQEERKQKQQKQSIASVSNKEEIDFPNIEINPQKNTEEDYLPHLQIDAKGDFDQKEPIQRTEVQDSLSISTLMQKATKNAIDYAFIGQGSTRKCRYSTKWYHYQNLQDQSVLPTMEEDDDLLDCNCPLLIQNTQMVHGVIYQYRQKKKTHYLKIFLKIPTPLRMV